MILVDAIEELGSEYALVQEGIAGKIRGTCRRDGITRKITRNDWAALLYQWTRLDTMFSAIRPKIGEIEFEPGDVGTGVLIEIVASLLPSSARSGERPIITKRTDDQAQMLRDAWVELGRPERAAEDIWQRAEVDNPDKASYFQSVAHPRSRRRIVAKAIEGAPLEDE
jgi:hypothetical protein